MKIQVVSKNLIWDFNEGLENRKYLLHIIYTTLALFKKPLNYTTPYLHYQKLIEAYFKPLTQMEYLALVSFQTPFNSLKIESG